MDIKTMMQAILGKGFTIERLAQKLGISVASVNRIKAGKQVPRYPLGAKIAELHRAVTGDRDG